MTEVLKLDNVAKSYHDGTRELRVLSKLNLTVKPGEAVAVVGMSGAGKSTFLHLIAGLDYPDKGAIQFQGDDITKWPRARMNQYRSASIGMVFQFHHLLPEFSALENVMMPALVARRPRAEAESRAKTLIAEVGLTERETHRPAKLSGGEQQRIALARSLMNDPQLLLADEPTGNLDPRTGEKIIQILWDATVRKNRSLIIVTHEPAIARRANSVYLLKDGALEPLRHEDVQDRMAQPKTD